MSEDDDKKLPAIQNRRGDRPGRPARDRLPAQPVLPGGATAQPAGGARLRASEA